MLFIFHGNFISNIWGGTFKNWLFWQVLFLAVFIYGYRTSNEIGRRLCAWGLGIILASAMSYPMMAIDNTGKIASISVLPNNAAEMFSVKSFNVIRDQTLATAKAIFIADDDKPDTNVYNDPFFDYHAVVFVILGLISMVFRPSWWKTFLFIGVGVAIIPRVFTLDPESSKIMGILVPALLLGAMAIADWIECAWVSSGKNRWMGILLVIGLTVFWGWEIKGTFLRVFDEWWFVKTIDTRLNDQVELDIRDKRVYMVPSVGFRFFSVGVMGVLKDREPLYLARDVNQINVVPGEQRRDVVVLVSPLSTKVVDRLKKEFPSAQWSAVWQVSRSPELGKLSYRVLIPASAISSKPGKTFWFHEVPKKSWIRRVYPGYAMARAGMILFEDAKPALNPMDTTVAKGGGEYSIWAENEWEVPQEGRYDLSVETFDFVQIFVDGKMLLEVRPRSGMVGKGHGSVHLKKGPHVINCLSLNAWKFPDVIIRNSDLKMEQVLGR